MVMTTDGDYEGEKSSNIDESEVTIDFAVEVDEVSLNVTKAPFQLLRAERELLNSCIQDQGFRKRGGNIDWDKIENIFEDKADGHRVFKRDRKRLRSTSNKLKVQTVGISTTNHNSSVQELLPIEDIMMDVMPTIDTVVEDRTIDESVRNSVSEKIIKTGEDLITKDFMEDTAVSVSTTSQSIEPKRRVGNLSDLEREFVKNYGKKCLTMGKNIDNNCMLKEYRTVFPDFSRDGDILKKCWNNWKKDSPAYKEFINKLNK